jgi:hypothetical protein
MESDAPTENAGIAFLQNLFGGTWIETFADGSSRKQMASVGGKYDEENNVFLIPQPYFDWVLNSDFDWVPPIHYPSDGKNYHWDDATHCWQEHEFCCQDCAGELEKEPAFPVTTPWKY